MTQNNLLPFDPKLAKNGDVVWHIEHGDVYFVGMQRCGFAAYEYADKLCQCDISWLRLRPRMVKLGVNIYWEPGNEGKFIHGYVFPSMPVALEHRLNDTIKTIEIEVPEGV